MSSTLVLSPSTTPMPNQRLGILLNPGPYPTAHWAPTPPPPRLSTADSLPLHSRSNSVARKIRFAPLPDPRRLDEPESDATTDDSTDTNETKKPGQLLDSQESSSASLIAADLDAPASPVPSTTSGDTETPRTGKRWAAKILKPLLPRKARSSLDDGNLSPFSSGLGLPRSSSRDSTHSFSSIASGHSSKGSRRPFAANSPLKPNIPLGPPLSHSTSGQRMLNGRVYGAPRDPSPGRAGRSFEEPKFVEWGYGGMGSVQNQTLAKGGAAADWGKLQSNARTIGSSDADAEAAAAAEDEDDGSGMAWVRRRRAQKEKERLEKERQEREAAAAAAAAAPAEDAEKQDAKDDDTASTHEATSSKVADVPSISIQPAASAANSRPETPTATTLLRAPSISRNISAASGTTIKEPAREAKEIDISDHTTNTVNLSAKLHAHGRAHGTPEKPARAASPSPERSSDSSATGDDDADEEDEGDDDDSTVEDGGDDEVEEEDESARKTAASAGVEKLVRHHH
ncbi:hypothetical protein AURDEDRAFT_110821 [Auricularia subglabra TFB-10046 SS5]|nr:hypothetical protein AURDEDRAFT_110821 [Auricularia subglabra TFB-10046 SS5]